MGNESTYKLTLTAPRRRLGRWYWYAEMPDSGGWSRILGDWSRSASAWTEKGARKYAADSVRYKIRCDRQDAERQQRTTVTDEPISA